MESLTLVELKDCPFCGGKSEFGVNSGDSWAIRCTKCRAKIVKDLDTKYFPKGTWVKGDFKKTQIKLSEWAYNKLVPKWNKRTK